MWSWELKLSWRTFDQRKRPNRFQPGWGIPGKEQIKGGACQGRGLDVGIFQLIFIIWNGNVYILQRNSHDSSFTTLRADSKHFWVSHVSPMVSKGCLLGKVGRGGRQGDYTPFTPTSRHPPTPPYLHQMKTQVHVASWAEIPPFSPNIWNCTWRFPVYKYAN